MCIRVAAFTLIVVFSCGLTSFADEITVGPIRSLAFSPDGKWLAVGAGEKGKKGYLALFDLSAHRWLWTHLETQRVVSVAFHPDGKVIALAAYGPSARLLDATTGKPLADLGSYDKELRAVAFSPDGRSLAVVVGDGTLRLWDVPSQKEQKILRGHTKPVFSVTFSPDGKRLASAGEDAARLWDVADARETHLLRLASEREMWTALVQFSPDGRWLFTGGLNDGRTLMWEAATGEFRAAFRGGMDALAVTGAGRGTLACAWGRSIELFDKAWATPRLEESERIRTLLAKLDDDAYVVREAAHKEMMDIGLVAEPELRRAMKESPSVEVRIRARRIRAEILSRPSAVLKGVDEDIKAMAFSPDGKVLVSGHGDGGITLWNIAEGRHTGRFFLGMTVSP